MTNEVNQATDMDQILKRRGVMEFVTMLIDNERGYIISDLEQDIGNDASISLYIQNPSDCCQDYNIVIDLSATGLVSYDISKDITVDTEGSSVEAHNLNIGSDREFTGDLQKTTGTTTGSYTRGTTIMENFIPGSERGNKVGGTKLSAISLNIAPDENLLIDLYNRSGGNLSYMDISVMIFEVDENFQGKIVKQ